MTKRRTVDINIGKRSLPHNYDPPYPSEAGYVEAMRAQSKAMTDALLGILKDLEEVSIPIMLDALAPTKALAEYYTPKDTHALVNSAYLVENSFRGKPRVELGFARGGHPHYAAYVHENLAMGHAEPTSAKFLERAMKEDMDNIRARIYEGYAKVMGRAGA